MSGNAVGAGCAVCEVASPLIAAFDGEFGGQQALSDFGIAGAFDEAVVGGHHGVHEDGHNDDYDGEFDECKAGCVMEFVLFHGADSCDGEWTVWRIENEENIRKNTVFICGVTFVTIY